MKMLAVKPKERIVEVVTASNVKDALDQIGLKSGEVDFGTVVHWSRSPDRLGLSIVTYEFGLLRENPNTRQRIEQREMFGLLRHMYAGNCLLYCFDEAGENAEMTDDFEALVRRDVIWLPTIADAELAITVRKVERPYIGVNNQVLSSWPNMKL